MTWIENTIHIIIIICLAITSLIYTLWNMDPIGEILDKRYGQGHVYCVIFLFVGIIGFTGLANVLFKLNLFL
jgi:hypothetical protein